VRDNAGRKLDEGDLVVPAYFATCNECARCGRGQHQYCENAYKLLVARPPTSGPTSTAPSRATTTSTTTSTCTGSPTTSTRTAAAAANCVRSQVLHGLDAIEATQGDTVVVQGAGGLGLNATAVATERGAETIVVDGVADRLDRAEVVRCRPHYRPERVRDCGGERNAYST